ncbi:MAG: response regulator transcription factor [Hyphomicrobiales bacterium]|nr:MAG: response regulator transcription factor [Hyphomicrobiales bacterium]
MGRAKDTSDLHGVVLVVDDDPSVRAAICDLLESVPLKVQALASAEALLDRSFPDAPCCLVLDVRMPGMNGLELQRHLHDNGVAVPIVFITAHGDVPMSVSAMKSGAIEFLTKPFRDQDLIDAVVAGLERDRMRRADAMRDADLLERYALLSDREKEILRQVVTGALNKQIAGELRISEITVKVRRGSLMRKLHARSITDLVRFADRLAVLGIE